MSRRRIIDDMVLLFGGGAAAPVPWYLSGGVLAANCIGAYVAVGAASKSASYINLANPGTYDITELADPPTWNAGAGWICNGSVVLATGWVPPTTHVRSMIVKFSNALSGHGVVQCLMGVRNNTVFLEIHLEATTQNPSVLNGVNGVGGSSQMLSGILAVAGLKGYRDGVAMGNITASTYDVGGNYLIIGGRHNGGGVTSVRYIGNIQWCAMYDVILTQDQVIAIGNAGP